MSSQPRPLIDRRRTSSRDRGALHHHSSYSRDSSPVHSPVGSPTNSSAGLQHLRSALKHGHVHPEPREGVDLDETAANAQKPCSPPPRVTSSAGGAAGENGEQSGAAASAPQYSRRVGFDTFDSGADLEEKGGSTGGGTGASLLSSGALAGKADGWDDYYRSQLLVHYWR